MKAIPHHSSCTKFGPLSFFPSEDINSRDHYLWCDSFYVEQYRDSALMSTVGFKQPEATFLLTAADFSQPALWPPGLLQARPGRSSRCAAAPLCCLCPTCWLPPSPPEPSLTHPRVFLSQNNTQTKPSFPQYSNSWAACVWGENMCSAVYWSILNEV